MHAQIQVLHVCGSTGEWCAPSPSHSFASTTMSNHVMKSHGPFTWFSCSSRFTRASFDGGRPIAWIECMKMKGRAIFAKKKPV